MSEDLPTLSSPVPGARTPVSPSSAAGAGSSAGARFLPGAVLSSRYRIVALLGQGGMGEVYRADDLTLGQPVALKFLPAAGASAEMLTRFRNEVRIARRVSHRNVCRVYDIGEAEGRPFLSMEYVDGEDLASLLKRIGRLPPDKALDVARRVCAGVAAAHEKGVLHRDLKPANVMLDGQGEVVITDFGLAAFADQVPEGDARSGTPSYMAPEQIEKGEVTSRSDIYALGLVLYEVFTGKRAFAARSLVARRERGETRPDSPSSHVRDLDPAVEHAILWCLEPDPARRPRSALAVAAALPGGDPLAAALEAGHTPSPEVVADAGETTGLSPRAAIARLALVVAGLGAILALSIRSSGLDRIGVEAPDALSQKAGEILTRLGYEEKPLEVARGFGAESDLIQYLEARPGPRTDWNRALPGRPPVVFFWYRTSPRRFIVTDLSMDFMTPGIVWIWNPPATIAGMVNVGLDAQGRLNFLQVLPPEVDETARPAQAPDWDALFAAASLDRAQFSPSEPRWTSLAASDARAAWTGLSPGSSIPLRVEAASFRGKPVFFQLVGPWTHPYRTQPDPRTARERAAGVIGVVLAFLALCSAGILARRNLFTGRGDRRGALRLAGFVFCAHIVLWICRAHHVVGIEEFGGFALAVAGALFFSGLTWLLYHSLEPYVRKHWPQTLISWSRLLAGRLRDPLVGRDLLSGVILGLLWGLIAETFVLAIQGTGAFPQLGEMEYLLGGRRILGAWLGYLLGSIRGTLSFFLILFLLRVLLKRRWLAALAFVAVFAGPPVLASRHVLLEAPMEIAIYSIAAFAVVRFGLVALAAGILTANALLSVPVTASLSSWYAGSSAFVYASVLALGLWGFSTSLAGRRFWKADLLE
ncbi:MAG TPA: serine/threonine-protein kinase [Vicinamibacteria bacterium]|nr:serine/threonine-protein kinase [Vicinamibacteria bacterium]